MGSTQVLREIMSILLLLLLSILRQQAKRTKRRCPVSSATGLATRPHLYRSKGLNLLSPSMQVLIDTDGRSANGNVKQEGVAIVGSFKASKVTSHHLVRRKTCIMCYHVGYGTEST